VNFNGDHGAHTVAYSDGRWSCDCSFFATRGVCSHVMTLERILMGMVLTAQATPMPA
jgi:hypothetical protein